MSAAEVHVTCFLAALAVLAVAELRAAWIYRKTHPRISPEAQRRLYLAAARRAHGRTRGSK